MKSLKFLALAAAGSVALGLSGAALGEIVPDACQETDPKPNFVGKFGGEPSCDAIANTTCCEIADVSTDPNNKSTCSAVGPGGKTLEVMAWFNANPGPGELPGVAFEVVQGTNNFGGADQALQKGTTGGNVCVVSWAQDVKAAQGLAFANKQGKIVDPQALYFFADAQEDSTPRAASKFIPNCRDLTTLAPGPAQGVTLTENFCPAGAPGQNQLLINVLEVRDSAGNRIPFFGQQIGDDINNSDIDTSNYCVCNFLPVQPDEIQANDGRDYACDEFTAPGELNLITGEYGCEIENSDDPSFRVMGGLQSINPTCSRWGTNRCY